VTTREALPVCGLRYGREEGYFGGMDLVFPRRAPVLAFIFLVLTQIFSATLSLVATLFLSYAVFLPWAIPLFRYSRVLWLYIDWQLDPVHEVKPAPLQPITAQAWSMPTPRKPWTHDSLFALTQHLAMLIDPVFDRMLPRREVDPVEGRERRPGNGRFGILGERMLPCPAKSFAVVNRSRLWPGADQQLVLIQEHDPKRAAPRVIIVVRTAPAALKQIDRVLVETYGAAPLSSAPNLLSVHDVNIQSTTG
jgi:hypothetical protein